MFKRILCFVLIFFSLTPSVTFSAPSVSAETGILIELTSGKVLWEKNAHKKMPMASTTKIMTAICVIENCDIEKTICVDDRAVGTEGSSMYLKKGEKIKVIDLLYGLLLNSGNDSANALAYAVSGSLENFCKLMNETALKIGAKDTSFKNPSGLYDDDHYTTAYDLAVISAYAMKNPLFSRIVSEKEKTILSDGVAIHNLRNHNKLLWRYDGCTGIKTGYTKKCGRCLVSSAQRGNVSLVCVTLNAPDDWNDHINLLNFGFSTCRGILIAESGDYAKTAEIKGGEKDRVRVKFKDSLSAVFTEQEDDITNLKLTFYDDIKAPVKKGDTLGKAELYVKNELFSECDLVSDEDILKKEKKGFRKMFFSSIKTFLSLYKHREKIYNYKW